MEGTMIHAPLLAVEGHDSRLGADTHVSQLCPSLGWGDHPFLVTLVSDAGNIVGEEEEEK